MGKGFIYSPQISLFGQPDIIGFGNDVFFIKEINRELANKIIIQNHYSKKNIFGNLYTFRGV